MKTFREYMIEQDKRRLAEADESKHLRDVLVHVMGLEEAIDSKSGEQIPLDQLNLEDIKDKLTNWSLWDEVPDKSKKDAESMLRDPQNKRLADLLDVLTAEGMSLKKVTTQDEDPSTPQQSAPAPQPQ